MERAGSTVAGKLAAIALGVDTMNHNSSTHTVFIAALVFGLVMGVAPVPAAHAATFTVNSTVDAVDTKPGDGACATATGQCTLRAAIMEANALPSEDTVILPAGTYTLTIAGDEHLAAQGDLDILLSNLTIKGAGAKTTIIDANGIDRVFHVFASATANFSGVQISGGRTSNAGGAIYTEAKSTLILMDSVVSGNSAAIAGGGICINFGALRLMNSIVIGNSATRGGGIVNFSGEVALVNSTVAGNSSSGNNNTAGGIYNDGTLTMLASTVSGNSSQNNIGGIQNGFETGGPGPAMPMIMTIANSTISGNIGANEGGGIGNYGNITITNSTISGNSASVGAGLWNGPKGTVALKNTIIASQASGGDCFLETPTLTSLGQNLDSDKSCNLVAPDDLPGVDPRLGPLQDNGGPALTHALLPGSRAIDAVPNADCTDADGKPLTTDQRGVTRPRGTACDIGAFEAEAPRAATFTVNSTADAVDTKPGDGVCATATGQCTLRAAIMEANVLAGEDTITLPAGTYKLTIMGPNENAAATGDLDITSNLTITGAGASTTIIDANRIDLVFQVIGSVTANFSGVRISGGNGGGIVNHQGRLILTDSTVSGNSGGGGVSNQGTLTLMNSTVSGNSGTDGGGIFNGGEVTLINSTVAGNTSSDGSGGGIFNAGAFTMIGSTVSGNSAAGIAGGIQNSGTATIVNSTISGNISSDQGDEGGGIANIGKMTITNSTVSGNSASVGGGLLNSVKGTVVLKNTIIASQASGSDCFTSVDTAIITSLGRNLDSDKTCNLVAPGDLPGVNLRLGPLQDNGGPTLTRALLPGSPAIDAVPKANCTDAEGKPLTTDQRGVNRPQGTACDIGAFEAPAQRAVFPKTSVLDDFKRGDGKIGNNWHGDQGRRAYWIVREQLDVQRGGSIVWKPAVFDATQEAFITLVHVDVRSRQQRLLLKVQGQQGNWRSGAIAVFYNARDRKVGIETFVPREGWTNLATFDATLRDGDQLGGRVLADGRVQVYVRGVLAGERPAGKFFAGKGGRIGLWFVEAANAVLDDFGGGTITP